MLLYILPIISAFLWAVVNFLDKYLIDRVSKERGVGSLVIFSSLAGVPVCLFILLYYKLSLFSYSFETVFPIILAGFVYLLGIVPYLYALNDDDTTSVAPQMLLIPLFSLLLSYLFLGEVISLFQIIGGVLLLNGAFFLNIYKTSDLRMSLKVFLLMFVSSLMLAINAVMFKYFVLDTIPFWHAIFWEHVGFIIFGLFSLLFVRSYRADFLHLLRYNSRFILSVNLIGEFVALMGNFIFHYTTLLLPVGVVNLIAEGTQPFMVLLLGLLLSRAFSSAGIEEGLSMSKLYRKSFFIILMVLGLYLVTI